MQSYQILLAFSIFLIAVPLYAIVPAKFRYLVLLTMSLLCFAYVSKYDCIFLLFTILSTYGLALLLDFIVQMYPTKGLEKPERKKRKAMIKRRKKCVVFFYCVLNLGLLLLLKYAGFFLSVFSFGDPNGAAKLPFGLQLALPLGISYYTLQALSYVIDVYRGKYKAERNPLKLALFIGFFPQLHEGPFGRYDALIPQLTAGKQLTVDNLYTGGMYILIGLAKILMIANRAGMLSDSVFLNAERFGGWVIAFGGIMFTLQLYAEFSGYIDLARGVSKLFGIDLAINFDMPFLAQNVADFWRRWHISLGAFFRDYVFYPVSTSKWLSACTKKLPRALSDFTTITVSLFIVWFLTGLWHGASGKYIVYGLYYFVLIVLFNLLNPLVEKGLRKLHVQPGNKLVAALRVLKTLVLVCIGMILFRAENISAFGAMMRALFTRGEAYSMFNYLELKDCLVLLFSVVVLLALTICKQKGINLWAKYLGLKPYKRYLLCFAIFIIVMIYGAYGLDYLPPDPIYGGF